MMTGRTRPSRASFGGELQALMILARRRPAGMMKQIHINWILQRMDYYPAVYCYDENGNDSSWPHESTITIVCYDIVVHAAADKRSNERGGWSAMTMKSQGIRMTTAMLDL